MYTYSIIELRRLLRSIVREHVDKEALAWLEEKLKQTQSGQVAQLNAAFAAMPRKTGKKVISIKSETERAIHQVRPGFTITSWTIDRLSRVWLLLHVDPKDKASYLKTIENMFGGAEMNELVALYSSLPVLAYPDSWGMRCAEGIRSNIAPVLESIMCHNPYPSEHLAEAPWNQLVLKAFFTEKPVHNIVGLDRRANANLARILSDYAHERWAAHRTVNPQLWRCVGRFVDEKIFPDIERIAFSENTLEREAAVLACRDSNYQPCQTLIGKNIFLKSFAEDANLTWNTLAEKAEAVSH